MTHRSGDLHKESSTNFQPLKSATQQVFQKNTIAGYKKIKDSQLSLRK